MKNAEYVVFSPDRTVRDNLSILAAAMEQAKPSDVRCIAVIGEGGWFLAGEMEGEAARWYEKAFEKNQVPVIAAVNGVCSGVGRDLLDRADLAVAGELAVIEGADDTADAARRYLVNETVPGNCLEDTLNQYITRLAAIPEPLITFGHKIYFAMEKLPDKPSRSRYGSSVQGEIMTIQAELNRKLRESGGEDPHSLVRGEEKIGYRFDYDASHAVLFEIKDHVEYIQLNVPQYKNMYDWRSSLELAGAYAVANSIEDLKAIVVTGTGKYFHLGGLRHDQDSQFEKERFEDQLKIRNKIMREIKVPLISAVQGECSGGGMSLVLKSQYALASENATFGYPEVKHNGFACNSMVNTMGVIPKKAALKCFYYGDLFTAREAQSFGFIQKVVPEGMLMEEVEQLLKTL